MLWMRGSFLHNSVPRPLYDCPQDRIYRIWDRTSNFVAYRWILEPMSENMFVLPHDSDFWRLEISVALFGVHDLCCPSQPLWARARGIVEPVGVIFPCPHSNRCLMYPPILLLISEISPYLYYLFWIEKKNIYNMFWLYYIYIYMIIYLYSKYKHIINKYNFVFNNYWNINK